MLFSEKVPELCKLLINELNTLKEHLLPALMQFKAFKSAREKAMSRSALTIHVDLSENAKLRQSREEKSAYYNETQVSIHCGYVRYGKDGYSFASMSDCTKHDATAVMASLDAVLGVALFLGTKYF